MRPSVRLGRIDGVEIGFNWSLLIIAALLAVECADGRFPIDAPGYTQGAYDIAGAVASVLFLAGVLLHELGHALVARRAGLKVGGITLSFLGGLTSIEEDLPTPGAELKVAGVGPTVSLALGGAFALAHLGMQSAHGSPLWLSAFGWLAWINIALAVMNLLPAAPLDGGRLLHAAVWKITGDPNRATRTASAAGVVLGGVAAAIGLVLLARHQTWNGFVFLVGGWFLVTAARAEQAQGQIQETLGDVTVAQVMRPVVLAPGWLTAQAFLDTYAGTYPGAVFMLERWQDPAGGYAGLTTAERLATVPPPDRHAYRAMDVAAPMSDVVYARPEDPALDLLAKMEGHRPALVIGGQYTVGGVLPSDLERLLRHGRPGPKTGQPVH